MFLAAAKVGGILANNTLPAEFIYDNLMIAANVDRMPRIQYGVEKLLFLGSSCIYPRWPPQPITESALLTGPLEPTNESYAIAKIAGIKLCRGLSPPVRLRLHLGDADQPLRARRQLRPQLQPRRSPALIRKFHEAKHFRPSATSWSGAPARRAANSSTSTTSPTPASI